jgi:hypothetical protein
MGIKTQVSKNVQVGCGTITALWLATVALAAEPLAKTHTWSGSRGDQR